jgi:maltose-binding protein MalE
MHISILAFPSDQILEEFMFAGKEGLGPTMLLFTDNWIGQMADSGLLSPLYKKFSRIGSVQYAQFCRDPKSGTSIGHPIIPGTPCANFN